VDRRNRDNPAHAARQLRVARDERIRLELCKREVLGVIGRRPAELIGDIPGSAPEDGVAEEADRHPPNAREALARDLGGEVAPLDGLVKRRQRLRTKERRREELLPRRDLDAVPGQSENRAGVDDEPFHGRATSRDRKPTTARRPRTAYLLRAA